MTARNGLSVAFAGAVFVCSCLPGQELRVLDGVGVATATYDGVRNRVVALGYGLETREFDGVRWRVAAQPLPAAVQDAQIVFDPLHGRTLACRAPIGGNLTLERYDGVSWQPLAATNAPPERHGFACVFDFALDQLVLFGGYFAGEVPTDETWTFDGTTWMQHTPTSTPQPRIFPSMAFDAIRGRTVLFDGAATPLPETWEWDGTAWNQVATATTPPARGFAGMGYDPVRGRTVLFGGVSTARLADLWEYDGLDWHLQTAAGGPSARWGAQCVFDLKLGRMRVFGGSPDRRMDTDMWTWNGAVWRQQVLPAHPGARGVLGMVGASVADPLGRGIVLYQPDEQSQASTWLWDVHGWHPIAGVTPSNRAEPVATSGSPKAYLHGGTDPWTGKYLSDLWSFDGSTWTLEATTGPSPRLHHALAFDQARSELVLFGGFTALSISAETWVFDGIRWTQRQPATAPTAREFPMMAYDLARGRTVLAGGFDASGLGLHDTWEWDGINWTQVTTAVGLPASYGRSAFDAQRGQVVLIPGLHSYAQATAFAFDGIDWNPVPLSSSAWVGGPFDAVGHPYPAGLVVVDLDHVYGLGTNLAQVAHYGTACTTRAPDLGCNGWPRVGDSNLGIDVVGAPSSSLVAVLAAVQSANLPIAGCTLFVQQGQAAALLPTSVAGFTTWPLPLPRNSGLIGIHLFCQAAALDASAPGGITLSRGMQITLGN